jgi:hypothetical protein
MHGSLWNQKRVSNSSKISFHVTFDIPEEKEEDLMIPRKQGCKLLQQQSSNFSPYITKVASQVSVSALMPLFPAPKAMFSSVALRPRAIIPKPFGSIERSRSGKVENISRLVFTLSAISAL